METEMQYYIQMLQKQFPLPPMGVLAPVSAHVQYSCLAPINMSGKKCDVCFCRVTFKHLPQP